VRRGDVTSPARRPWPPLRSESPAAAGECSTSESEASGADDADFDGEDGDSAAAAGGGPGHPEPVGRLTDAQRRLLAATLTPARAWVGPRDSSVGRHSALPGAAAGTHWATELERVLGAPLPAPPPPPTTGRGQRASRRGSAVPAVGSAAALRTGGAAGAPEGILPAPAAASLGAGGFIERAGLVGAEVEALQAPPVSREPSVSASAAGRRLFNLDVDIGGGRKGRIVVCEGAVPQELAAAFADSHGLPPGLQPRLASLISSAIRAQKAKAGGGTGL
jgi:hypothetical protein